MLSAEHCFPVEHPAAQGHFPGNPIIPGAVLLSETLRTIEASRGLNLPPARIESAKFLHPTRPGDSVRIEFSDAVSGPIRFACSVGPVTVLTGVAVWERVSTPT